MVHFHPEGSSPASVSVEALARPPSAFGAKGHAVFTLFASFSGFLQVGYVAATENTRFYYVNVDVNVDAMQRDAM